MSARISRHPGTWRETSRDPFGDWTQHRTGLYVPPAATRRERPVAIDLFCGAGGFSLGVIMGGFEVVAAVDNDPICMVTYLTNLGTYPVDITYIEPQDRERADKELKSIYRASGHANNRGDWKVGSELAGAPLISGSARPAHIPGVRHFFLGDVKKLTGEQILRTIGMQPGEVDLVCGGPPCQGFSMGGKRNVVDPRNSLVFEFARLVLEINPKTMVMENVPGMLSMVTPEGLPVVDALSRVLADGGFGTYDALRRSITSTAGVGAAMRGSGRASTAKRRDKRSSTPTRAAAADSQMSFLDGVS